MKTYSSQIAINNLNFVKKVLNSPQSDKHEQTIGLKWFRNTPQNSMKRDNIEKENILTIDIKKHNKPLIDKKHQRKQIQQKQKIVNKEDKYQCQNLKNRLNALEDRLAEIKKSYEYRKKKSQNFQIQKTNKKNIEQSQIENIKSQKLRKSYIKQFDFSDKINKQSQYRKQRFTVENQRCKVLQQININKPQPTIQSSQKIIKYDKKSHQIIEKYITKYQHKPFSFQHSTSEANLFNIGQIVKKNNENHYRQKRQNIYYISAVMKAFEATKPTSFDELCINHLLTSHQFLCFVESLNIQKKVVYPIIKLPPPLKKNTIIFDLDETLIHCLEIERGTTAEIFLPIKFLDENQQNEINIGINIRPYTKECLKQLNKYFQIMVFTASHQSYANAIADYLDPNKQLISYRFSREHCHKTNEGFYVKDLRVVDRKLTNILLIDNAALSYCFQPENGIPIVPFYDNKADLQLKNLIPYLKLFINENDVRIKNSSIMKLNEYTKYQNVEDLINGLYK